MIVPSVRQCGQTSYKGETSAGNPGGKDSSIPFDGCRSGYMPLIQISDDNPTGTAATHIRNLKTIRWNDGSKDKALINLGGGPRPTPKTRWCRAREGCRCYR